MKEVVEDCPVCGQHTFVWPFWCPECEACGWYPLSIPWDEEEVNELKQYFEEILK